MTPDPVAAVSSHPTQAALALAFAAAWVVVEFFARRSTLRQGAERRPSHAIDRGTYPIIGIAVGLSLLVSLACFLFGVGGYLPLGTAAVGVAVMAAGLAMRAWALVSLGRFFTMPITLRDDHRIVETGPYRWLRHPAYTGGFLLAVGWPLILGTLPGFAVAVLACGFAYVHRMRTEEKVLIGRFGEDYRNYAQRTWRLLPWVY